MISWETAERLLISRESYDFMCELEAAKITYDANLLSRGKMRVPGPAAHTMVQPMIEQPLTSLHAFFNKGACVLVLTVMIGGAVFAQTPSAAAPGGFVPYTVTLDQNQALMQYLVQQPYSFAEPVIRRLTELEAEAQRAAATPAAPPAQVEPAP